MFSHIFVGVQDFDRALSFYRALMQVLGLSERFCERDRPLPSQMVGIQKGHPDCLRGVGSASRAPSRNPGKCAPPWARRLVGRARYHARPRGSRPP